MVHGSSDGMSNVQAKNTTANNPDILASLPAFTRNLYPVDPQYALLGKDSHLLRSATDVFDMLMPAYRLQ